MADPSLPLEAWSNFYVIVGSAAGGLTGLTFVVIALVADAHAVRPTGLRAFVTPTIVHFSSVLALAAVLNVPGQSAFSAGVCLALLGLGGVIYSAGTVRHLRRTRPTYQAVAEDWIWNALLPCSGYLALLVAGASTTAHALTALYVAAVVSLLLLFVGIHNAWDIAVWITVDRPGASDDPAKTPPPRQPPAP